MWICEASEREDGPGWPSRGELGRAAPDRRLPRSYAARAVGWVSTDASVGFAAMPTVSRNGAKPSLAC